MERNGFCHQLRDAEMGHENGSVDHEHAIEQVSVNGRFSGQKEGRYQENVNQREKARQKERTAEYGIAGVQLIRNHVVVNPVVEQKSADRQKDQSRQESAFFHGLPRS